MPIRGLSILSSFSVRLFSTRRCFWFIPEKEKQNHHTPEYLILKHILWRQKKCTFGEMEDSKLFVRKVTQPEKLNEEKSVQFNIAYSNFFHLKVQTNMHPVWTGTKRKIVCSRICYNFIFAWCRNFISQGTFQK